MDDDRVRFFEQAGIAALIPGYTDTINYLQAKRGELLARLAELQNGGAVKAKPGRPAGRKNAPNSYWASMTPGERSAEMLRRGGIRKDRALSPQASYWAKLTPEERSAEMKRRVGKQARMHGKQNLGGGPNHPRNADHPGHAAWLKKMRQVSKASWTKLTPEQRAERQAKMARGRAA